MAKGWTLVPVRDKRPMGDAWNIETAMRNAADVARHLGPHSKANGVGVLLAESNLCSFDPDDLARTRTGLEKIGIDVDAVLDSGWRIASGKPNSARALFALPNGEALRWMRLRIRKPLAEWKADADGVLHPTYAIVFELRATSPNLQDVLPPSLHNTGTTYSAPPLPQRLPMLADPLLALWRRWQANPRAVEAELFEAFGVPAEDRVVSLSPDGKKLDFPSGARSPYNAANTVESIVLRHGYTNDGAGRYAHPGATGAPGCKPIDGKDDLWHSHNGGDPLCGTFDAWSAHVQLDHGGNQHNAEAAWYAKHPEFEAIEGEDSALAEPPQRRGSREITLHFGDHLSEETMDFLIEPVAPQGLAVGLYGGPGSGKSSLCATWAAATSAGSPIEGLRAADDGPYTRGSTLWVSSEEPRTWIHNRHLRAGGLPGTIVVPEVTVLERAKDLRPIRTSFDAEQDLQPAIEEANMELKRRGLPPVRLVVLDTVVALVHWGDEKGKNSNSDQAVKAVMMTFNRIADATGCCIVLIGHTNKDHRAPSREYRVAGSGSWVSGTRLPMFAEKDPNVPGRMVLASIRNSTGPEFAVAYTLREVHTLQAMRTQRRADGSPVRSTLQAVERFFGMAWDDAEIARLRNTFAPVEDPADAPDPPGLTKRGQAIAFIEARAKQKGYCRRTDVPLEFAPSSGADWRHIDAELIRRGLYCTRERGKGVIYDAV